MQPAGADTCCGIVLLHLCSLCSASTKVRLLYTVMCSSSKQLRCQYLLNVVVGSSTYTFLVAAMSMPMICQPGRLALSSVVHLLTLSAQTELVPLQGQRKLVNGYNLSLYWCFGVW